MKKLLAVVTGIAIFSIAPTCEAKPKRDNSILDIQTTRIIYSRVCNLYYSRKYTTNEIFNYTVDTIEVNSNLRKMPNFASGGLADGYLSAVSESFNIRRESTILKEANLMMRSVMRNKDCQN